ncbi:MAG: cyanophycinase [Rhodothermales bacterium]|jgi:cyanophycinase|nr:cyanophycinase [Rhodothermales bacterium]MDG2015469.1 cyanophycinase [Rhodothermales bacterium]
MLKMRPTRSTGDSKRGYLIPIGGAEEKETDRVILERFVELCGGSDANIVIIPTASRLADTGSSYVQLFESMGASHVDFMQLLTRADCEDISNLNRLDKATGIFITGGNQLRLSTIIGGTPMADQIRYLNAHEVHVAGTSAGAGILSEHMVAGGESGPIPTLGKGLLSPGLGLTNSLIIDQHFSQRGRLGRLLSLVAFNPFSLGLGVDEDTAAFIDPDGVLEVVGSGGITIVDPSDLEYSSVAEIRKGEVVTMLNLKMHILASGGRFDVKSRRPIVNHALELEEQA